MNQLQSKFDFLFLYSSLCIRRDNVDGVRYLGKGVASVELFRRFSLEYGYDEEEKDDGHDQ